MTLRNIFLAFPIALLVYGVGWTQDCGVPYWLWCATYSVINSPGHDRQACSWENADRFYSALQSNANQVYPSIDIQRTINRHESEVTKYNFALSGEAGNNEFVFFENHGNSYRVYCWDNDATLEEMYFTGYTKWIFLKSCSTFFPGEAMYSPYMTTFFSHGAHAVFGYASKEFQAQRGPYRCGFLWTRWCYECMDKQMYDNLFSYYARNNYTMWDAYIQAGLKQYQTTGHAHELACWSASAYSSTLGRVLFGMFEKINQTYYYQMNMNYGLYHYSEIVPAGGSPDYSGD